MLKRIFSIINEINYKYLFHLSIIRVEKGSILNIKNGVRIKKTKLRVSDNSVVNLGDNVLIKDCQINIGRNVEVSLRNKSKIINCDAYIHGQLTVGESTTLSSGVSQNTWRLTLEDGNINIGNNTRIHCNRILVRFGGLLRIGDYTNINEGSDIRVDEKIEMGSFNQISYNCMIWDTDTHNMYEAEKRRRLTMDKFPYFGYEVERPNTSPVIIGNDCWISRDVAILKGTKLGDRVIVGFGTTLIRKNIPANTTVTPEIKLAMRSNKL